jgi:hypothetical protein
LNKGLSGDLNVATSHLTVRLESGTIYYVLVRLRLTIEYRTFLICFDLLSPNVLKDGHYCVVGYIMFFLLVTLLLAAGSVTSITKGRDYHEN